jgi:hypothetical protein
MGNELSTGRIPPALHEVISKYGVNWQDEKDVVFAPMWDRQVYPAIGANNMRFFQRVQAPGVTLSDTSMTLAGQIPQPQVFLATGLYCDFRSGLPLVKGGQLSAAVLANAADDMAAVLYSGNLAFSIGTKDYAYGAPLAFFPPPYHLELQAALSDHSQLAAVVDTPALTVAASAKLCGDTFAMTPTEIPAGQNFGVTMEWPEGPVAPPSGIAGVMGVGLLGYMYRPVQ